MSEKHIYTLDEVVGSSEKFRLGGRIFHVRALSLGESLAIEAAGGSLAAQLQALSTLMTRRAVTAEPPVTSEWLADVLTVASGARLIELLRAGAIPGRENPNAAS